MSIQSGYRFRTDDEYKVILLVDGWDSKIKAAGTEKAFYVGAAQFMTTEMESTDPGFNANTGYGFNPGACSIDYNAPGDADTDQIHCIQENLRKAAGEDAPPIKTLAIIVKKKYTPKVGDNTMQGGDWVEHAKQEFENCTIVRARGYDTLYYIKPDMKTGVTIVSYANTEGAFTRHEINVKNKTVNGK